MTDKKEMFGAVEPPPNTGRHLPNYKDLRQPMKNPAKAAKVFCVGCGGMIEILPIGAGKLAKKAGLSALPDMANKYIEAESCIICGDSFDNVAIRDIETS